MRSIFAQEPGLAALKVRLPTVSMRVAALGAGLEARSPLQVFRRGFSVARDDACQTLTTLAAFVPGTQFELLVKDGRVRATTAAVHADAPHLRTDA